MATTIVFVRHGQAMPTPAGGTDLDRSLTDAGISALRAAFPRTFSLVDVDEGTELWVSPALRAKQTAAIANDTLGIAHDKIFQCQALYDQDEAEFLEQVAASGAQTVVAVGHVPFMDRMVEWLTGTYLGFSTGAAAAVKVASMDDALRPDGRLPGRLLWFVQGPRA